jgi:urease alpha subunit
MSVISGVKKTIFPFFVLFIVLGCSSQHTAEQPLDLLIKLVDVIDASQGHRKNTHVGVRDGKIVWLSASNNNVVKATETVIDGRGKYLIPGLWDAHVHLTFVPELESSMYRLFIANGITSVRDTGGQIDKVLAMKDMAESVVSPDVYIAVPLIDGHQEVYSGKVPGFPNIAISTQTVADVEKAVDDLATAGVDLVKAYEMLSPEALEVDPIG